MSPGHTSHSHSHSHLHLHGHPANLHPAESKNQRVLRPEEIPMPG